MRPTTIRLLLLTALIAVPGVASAAECVIGTMKGIPAADAETVADVICDAIRERGVDVGPPVTEAPGREAYRVDARTLGSKIFLTLTHDATGGGTLGRGTIDVNALEEVPVAAPRLAAMVLEKKSAEKTATVNSLVGEETREYKKMGGETLWGIGFSGIAVPGSEAFPGIGLVFRGAFETQDFSVLGDLRITGSDKTGVTDKATLFSANINGRYFFLDGGWTPYVGGGLGWSALALRVGEFESSDSGMAGNVEVGFEFLRFYKSRLHVDVRVDLPFFQLQTEEITEWDFRTGEDVVVSRAQKKYFTPITFGVTYLWW